jgi:hypothetical protein
MFILSEEVGILVQDQSIHVGDSMMIIILTDAKLCGMNFNVNYCS